MNKPNHRFLLDTTAQVSEPACHARLQIAVANLCISGREWPNEMQDFFLHLNIQGTEIWTQPERVLIPLMDDVWKSERYVRDFLASDVCKYPDRDKWLLLYFKCMKPNIYRHIVR